MRTAARLALSASLASFCGVSIGAPADYVYTPSVEYGEREIDFKFGVAKNRDGTIENATSLGLGWGVTGRWFTEVYAKWHKEPGAASGFDAWEWENRFQLTETGQYPIDAGFVIEIERPKDRSEGYELRWGPLLQADVTDRVQANLNVLVEKHLRSKEGGPAELGYQWQLRYRWQPRLDVGLQGFGELGPWDHWVPTSQQTHRTGPAIFGKLRVGQRQVIKYNAALLFGLTAGAPRNTFRLQAEYEF